VRASHPARSIASTFSSGSRSPCATANHTREGRSPLIASLEPPHQAPCGRHARRARLIVWPPRAFNTNTRRRDPHSRRCRSTIRRPSVFFGLLKPRTIRMTLRGSPTVPSCKWCRTAPAPLAHARRRDDHHRPRAPVA
jgi:hypothetical protein